MSSFLGTFLFPSVSLSLHDLRSQYSSFVYIHLNVNLRVFIKALLRPFLSLAPNLQQCIAKTVNLSFSQYVLSGARYCTKINIANINGQNASFKPKIALVVLLNSMSRCYNMWCPLSPLGENKILQNKSAPFKQCSERLLRFKLCEEFSKHKRKFMRATLVVCTGCQIVQIFSVSIK